MEAGNVYSLVNAPMHVKDTEEINTSLFGVQTRAKQEAK
jgi:hypothetical protein